MSRGRVQALVLAVLQCAAGPAEPSERGCEADSAQVWQQYERAVLETDGPPCDRRMNRYHLLEHARTTTAAEYELFTAEFEAKPHLQPWIWDAPDRGALLGLENLALQSDLFMATCPVVSVMFTVRAVSEGLVRARMERGRIKKDGIPGGAPKSTKHFVTCACYWWELYARMKELLQEKRGAIESDWLYALQLGERHVMRSFAAIGLDGSLCNVLTTDREPSIVSEHKSPRPRPDYQNAALPPLMQMVGLAEGCRSMIEASSMLSLLHRYAVVASSLRDEHRKSNETLLDSLSQALEENDFNAKIKGHFEERANRAPLGGHTCEQLVGNSGWHVWQPAASRCKHLLAAKLLSFLPGEIVLDWGSGCGHGLGWLATELKVRGVVVDLLSVNVEWARTNLPLAAAVVSSDYIGLLRRLPNAELDHFISNGALAYLRPMQQCGFVREVLSRVLRPGGTLWLGLLGLHWPPHTVQTFWRHCFRSAMGSAALYVVEEEGIFGVSELAKYQILNGSRAKTFSVFAVKV